MRRSVYIAALIMLCAVRSIASGFSEDWKRGTDMYLSKQYDSAVVYFERVAATKPQNSELYYNLGNSYYRLNRMAPAILNYQRALRIDPDNSDAKDNLAITQARIRHYLVPAEDIFFIKWWKAITLHTRANTWAILALILFGIALFSLWARRYTTWGRNIPVQVAGSGGLICVIFLVFGFAAAYKGTSRAGAVVMENDAALMNDGQKGKPLALLPEGTVVDVVTQQGMWVEVQLPDGRRGWILQVQLTWI